MERKSKKKVARFTGKGHFVKKDGKVIAVCALMGFSLLNSPSVEAAKAEEKESPVIVTPGMSLIQTDDPIQPQCIMLQCVIGVNIAPVE